jgi:hypothetical protein
MTARLPSKRLAATGSLLISLIAASCLNAADLDEIRSGAFKTACLLRSSSYEARLTNSRGGVMKLRFVRNGNKYLVDREDVSATAIKFQGKLADPLNFITSFDGDRYQSFDKKTRGLKISTGRQALGAVDPLLWPYSWLTLGLCNDHTWANVQNPEQWERRFADAQFVDRRQLDGRDFAVVEFPQTCAGDECIYRVYFDAIAGYYPVKFERIVVESNATSTQLEVTELETRQVAGETAPLPIKIEKDESGADGASMVIRQVVTLMPETIQLNAQIDDASFDLSKLEASSVYDVQQTAAALKRSAEQFDLSPLTPRSGTRWWLIGGNLAVVIGLLWAIWRFKRDATV